MALTRFDRFLHSVRSYWRGPLSAKSPEIARLWMGQESSTGIAVNEETAMNYAAVWSAVLLIADDVSSLPLQLLRRETNGGKAPYRDHPLYRLLHDQPNPEMSSMAWRQTIQAHVLTWGNGYSEIVRDAAGRPRELWPLTPDRVSAFRDERGALKYRVTNRTGREDVVLEPRDVLHIHGLGYDGVLGYSVIAKARESIGLGLGAEKFGGTFFGNGSTFGGVISYPTDPGAQVREDTRKALEARHQGVERAHKFLTLYGGAKYERLGIPPNDAQFLETRVFQIGEIARWFKVPPHKIGDLSRATFSNIEQQDLEYYKTTLRSWLEVWEQELTIKLISPLERNLQLIEHRTEGFLRADAAGRSALATAEFNIGGLTPNEHRALENRPNVDGGDRAFVQLNMIPLNLVDQYWSAEIENKKAASKPPVVAPDPSAQELKAFIQSLEQRMVEREAVLADEVAKRTALEHAKTQAETLAAEARAELTTALALAQEAGVAHARAQELEADVVAKREALAVAEGNLQRADADLAAMRATVTELQTKVQAGDAVICELRMQVQDVVSLRESLARVEAEKASALDAKTAVEGEQRAIREQLDAVQARLTAVADAHRGLIVETWQRIIQREVDRARKAQASPEKLRRHLDLFYPLYEDVCRGDLRSPVRAWLVSLGREADLDSVLDRIVVRHLNESMRALRLVAEEAPDGDALAPALERVLSRWEAQRAETVTDRLLREERHG